MALFSKTTDTKKKAAADVSTNEKSRIRSSSAHFLRHARITEKATMHSTESVYVFEVASSATKRDIALAIRDIYNVTPRMVRVAPIPTKTTRNMRTGVTGVKRGGKKAYVYLKKGETIMIA